MNGGYQVAPWYGGLMQRLRRNPLGRSLRKLASLARSARSRRSNPGCAVPRVRRAVVLAASCPHPSFLAEVIVVYGGSVSSRS